MKIQVNTGHLTATDKKVIRLMFDSKMTDANTKRKGYSIIKTADNQYTIKTSSKGRGIGLGGELRMETFTSTITTK